MDKSSIPEIEIEKAINLPDNLMIKYLYEYDKIFQGFEPKYPLAVFKDSIISSSELKEASYSNDKINGLSIKIKFTRDGKKKISKETAENIGQQTAIIIGGKIRLAPFIREQLNDDETFISGNFSESEMDDVLYSLNNDCLPYRVVILEKKESAIKELSQ
jgi:preprotein translocase subunit SecD